MHLGDIATCNIILSGRKILNTKFGHTIIDNVREVETCEKFVFKLCNESQNELLHRIENARA